MWGRRVSILRLKSSSLFQSTLPVWERHYWNYGYIVSHISIHSPRGRDRKQRRLGFIREISIPLPVGETVGATANPARYFTNPLSPCGERLQGRGSSIDRFGFQSTLPVWETPMTIPVALRLLISIHSPVWGRRCYCFWLGINFNPLSRVGRDLLS